MEKSIDVVTELSILLSWNRKYLQGSGWVRNTLECFRVLRQPACKENNGHHRGVENSLHAGEQATKGYAN
jgi:hypothetical protein